MLSIVKSVALSGLEGYLVQVQVDVSNGLPYWEIVGLPDASVRESKERVKIAIKNLGYERMAKRITINLAPANTRKWGSVFDLPIAIGILHALGDIRCKDINKYVFVGELSLDGKVRKVSEILAICIEAKRLGIENIMVSEENSNDINFIKGINIIPIKTLKEASDYLNDKIKIEIINKKEVIVENTKYKVDFSEVKGQIVAKRGIEIAAAGAHNCILIGSPGSGKTMLAERIPTILPDLTFEEALETTKINSISGMTNKNKTLLAERPFRAPHYTITPIALIGGGRIPKPRRNKFSKLWSTIFRRIYGV